MTTPFGGTIGRTYDDSSSWWPPLPSAPEGAPNVVVVLLDDVGYAQFGAYGSDIATPAFDRLAATGRRFANFHTTALCSPTRAALLSGRNHHSNGMARVVELAAGFPGYNATVPKENGFLSEILREAGYATYLRHSGVRGRPPASRTGSSGPTWPGGDACRCARLGGRRGEWAGPDPRRRLRRTGRSGHAMTATHRSDDARGGEAALGCGRSFPST
ncbi:MAG TPA: sulfatase-like hydrolase/transferase [Microthrixaceae bacterium]|nr:sulfatase-like hydrolase/transferase [Microthrixaceae bacterium]